MTDFEALLACYRSGQVSERQWQEHLKDREFREWVEEEAAMPDRVIMVRESEWREMREALKMARRALYMAAGYIDPRLKSMYGPILRDAIKVLGAVIERTAGGDDG